MSYYCDLLILGYYRLKKIQLDEAVIKACRNSIKLHLFNPWHKKYVYGDVDGHEEIYLVDCDDFDDSNQFANVLLLNACKANLPVVGFGSEVYDVKPIITKICDKRFKIKFAFYYKD